jgi:sugar (glycoside-pentoside-hexuronide) transporter
MNPNKNVDKKNGDDKVSNKEYAAYFCYGFGHCLSFGLVSSFILNFYTDVLGISAIVGGAICLVAKLWDLFADPLIAVFMDAQKNPFAKKKYAQVETPNARQKRFLPYLRIAAFIVAPVTLICFLEPSASIEMKTAYAIITYVLWGSIFAFSDIPFWAISQTITNSEKHKVRLLTTANISSLSGINVGIIIFPLLLGFFAKSHAHNEVYFYSALVMVVFAFLLMQFGYRFIKERSRAKVREQVSFKSMWQGIRQNKYMFSVLIIYFLNLLPYVSNALTVYFFKYDIKNVELMSIGGIVSFCAMVSMFFVPKLIRHFDKRKLFIVGLLIEIVLRVSLFVIGYANIPVMFTFWFFALLVTSTYHPIISTMLADTITYGEWKTGERTDAVVFSGQTYSNKLSVAFAGIGGGIMLTIIGYVPNASTQSSFTMTGLFFGVVLLPAVAAVIRLFLLWKYDYTDELHKSHLTQIKNRNPQLQ